MKGIDPRMPPPPKCVLVHAGEWKGLYIEGKLEVEGFDQVTARAALAAVGLDLQEVHVAYRDSLPVNLIDVFRPRRSAQ